MRDLFDRDLTIVYVSRQIDQKLGLPIASVADQAQVGERLLGRAEFLFHARQQVAEVDEQAAVAFVHVGWKNLLGLNFWPNLTQSLNLTKYKYTRHKAHKVFN